MRIAIIGRSEFLFNSALLFEQHGHEIALVITAKEAPEYKVKAIDFEEFAHRHNATFIKTAKINQPEVMEKIKACGKIDLGISINYSGILHKPIMEFFPLGILNAHGGDLPRYRGNACQAWAIINGENKIGLCIHKMVPGELDSGNIIERKYLQINDSTRIKVVYEWMEKEIPGMMLQAARALEKDSEFCLDIQSKNIKDALRCYPRKPEDGLINWERKNRDIIRLVNASSEPYSGAFSFLNGRKVTVWRASLVEDQEVFLAIPGQVASVEENGSVVVITGNGKVRIEEVSIGDDHERIKASLVIKSVRDRFTSHNVSAVIA